MEINKLLEYSIESGASDLHLSVGSIPMVRINGTMKPLNMEPLSKDQMDSIIPQVMDEEQMKKFNDKKEIVMIEKHDSISYIEFIRGKYVIDNYYYIQLLI